MTALTTWTIRNARLDDRDPLVELRRAAGWGEHDVAEWLEAASLGKRENWVAEMDGAVVGMVSLKYVDADPDVADGTVRVELSSLAVAVGARGLGLGRGLTEFAERRAIELGFQIVTLNTKPDNAIALQLYESMGYREHKRSQRDWGFAVHLDKRLRG